MPKYEIINAGEGVFSRPAAKGDGMVQPNTRRVLDLDEELSDSYIEGSASAGVFIKKSTAAAQNGEPLPGLDEQIALSRNRLMVASGQERDDIVAELRGEKKAKATATSPAASASTTAAPSAAPAPAAASAASAAGTSTAGR